MKYLTGKHLAFTLLIAGAIMAIVEEGTYKSGVGGVLFGTSGLLRGINTMLPAWYIPGTKTISVRYPQGVPLRLDGWLMLAGLTLWLVRR